MSASRRLAAILAADVVKVRFQSMGITGPANREGPQTTHKRPSVTAAHHATRHRQESTLLSHSASHSERLFLQIDTLDSCLIRRCVVAS